MSYLAIQSVSPAQPGQTLAGIAQGQNPVDSAFFGALMGDFSQTSSSLPTQAVMADSSNASLPPLLASEIALSQPLTSDGMIQATTMDDTLTLLSSSIETAERLSADAQVLSTATTALPPSTPVIMTEPQLGSAQTVAAQTVAAQTVAAQTVAAQTVAAQTVAAQTVAAQTVAAQTVAVQTVAVQTVAVQTVAVQTVATQEQLNKQQVTPSQGDIPETEFQRLSRHVAKSEGDVAISSLTGQPFFSSLADDQTVNQIGDDQAPLTIPITPIIDASQAVAASQINSQTMAHQVSSPVAVALSQETLSSAVSLGDEQGAPVFAVYSSNIAKDALATASKQYDTPINGSMAGAVGMTAATQQSAMMQQHSQSQQQQSDARADGALRANTSANSDASATQTDVESFASALTSFSPTSPLATPLTSPLSLRQPQWTQDMGNRMQMMVSQRMKEVEVKLDPVELGPVRIHLKMDEENKAHVTLSAQHGLTRDMLENALPRLRDMLAQQGIDVGSATVDSGAGQQASDQQQQDRGQNKGADLSNDAANLVSQAPVWKSIDGLVDHFV
jgi:flagellar hook-length control protein FliK